jgi:hypothetical protein
LITQHADDRDAARDCRLEVEVDALGFGDLDQLVAARGEERLISSDDRLPALKGVAHVAVRRIDPTHHLDDDIHVRIVYDRKRVVRQQVHRHVRAALFARIARSDPPHFDLAAEAAFEARCILCE